MEISRRQRVDMKLDKSCVVYLCVMKDFMSFELLTEAKFNSWLNEAMTKFSKETTVLGELLSHPVLLGIYGECLVHFRKSCAERVRFYGKYVRSLQWRRRRKRKRNVIYENGFCGICFESKRVILTKCGHHFCEACVDAWAKSSCPTCRAKSYV